jgi:hypothetical protein
MSRTICIKCKYLIIRKIVDDVVLLYCEKARFNFKKKRCKYFAKIEGVKKKNE